MLTPLALDQHVKVITNVIEFLRRAETKNNVPVFLEVSELLLTTEFELELNCVGLAAYQTNDVCLIAWRDELDSAKASYEASNEYREYRKKSYPEEKDEDSSETNQH